MCVCVCVCVSRARFWGKGGVVGCRTGKWVRVTDRVGYCYVKVRVKFRFPAPAPAPTPKPQPYSNANDDPALTLTPHIYTDTTRHFQ